MSKSDYNAVSYQILSYLYASLRDSSPVDPVMISSSSPLYSVKEPWWEFIMQDLCRKGLITGAEGLDSGGRLGWTLAKASITSQGIDLLLSESFQKKVSSERSRKEISPFP